MKKKRGGSESRDASSRARVDFSSNDSQPKDLDQRILQCIRRQPRQVAGYKQLVRELGLHGEERQQLASRLASLLQL